MRQLTVVSILMLLLVATAWAGRITEVSKELTSDKVSRLDVQLELAVGHYVISACQPATDLVARINGRYDERRFDYELDFSEDGEQGSIYFTTETIRKKISGSDDSDNNWEFRFSPDQELRLNIDIGAADAEFDFSDLSVSEIDLDVGAADAEISFSTPNKSVLESFTVDAGACNLEVTGIGNARFRELEFDGGVGSFLLDFTGEFDYEATADISVGLGSIDIILPQGLGVRLEVDDNWLNSIDFPRREFKRIGDDIYETENFDDADGQLTIYLDIGLGSADITFE